MALRGLVAGACRVRLSGLADRLHEIAFAGDRQLRTNSEQGGDRDALEQRPCVEVHLVGEAGVPTRVGRRHVVEPHRADRKSTSELQSLMRISYAVFCLKKKKTQK